MNENLFEIFRRSFPADLGRDLPRAAGRQRPQLRRRARAVGPRGPGPQDLGVKPGDRVAAQVEKSAEALMLYLGSLRAGAVYLPLNTAYTAGEIRYFLGDAEPTLFVCRPELERADGGAGPGARRAARADPGRARRRQPLGQGAVGRGRRCRRAAQQGRPRGLPLHLGHHRPVQGRHAQPRQPRLQRGGPARCLALHRRRPAAARAADLPHPRPVRRHQHHADGRRLAASTCRASTSPT